MYKNKDTGKLIAFDGPNGAGKSTLIRAVQARLSEMNINVHVTKEPSDSKIGTFTRNVAELFSGNALACLVAADRYAHVEREILPQLKQGTIVITDRYVLSSLILQPMDGVDIDFIEKINNIPYGYYKKNMYKNGYQFKQTCRFSRAIRHFFLW